MDSATFSENWKNLGDLDPGSLVNSRHQLHQAVQLVAAVGRNYHLPEKGDPFGTVKWLPDINGLAGWPVDTSSGKIKCALNFDNFTLQFLVDGPPGQPCAILAVIPIAAATMGAEPSVAPANLGGDEMREIAEEAFVYGFPMVTTNSPARFTR